MVLKRIEIKNFKGIKDLQIDFSENVTEITGRNGVGKSSIMDAWMWLIAGTDSFGRTKFNVRPIGNNTDDIEVKAEIDADGENITLCKRQTVDGNGKNTNHFKIGEWDYKEKDYKAKIEEIVCRLDLFRALSSPTGFTSLHWSAQRSLIMPLAEAIDEKSIADKELLDLLKEHDIDAITKKYDKDAKDIKKVLNEIPIRIDENELMKPEYMDMRINQLKEEQRNLAQSVANCEKVLFHCENYRKAKCEAVQDSINDKFPEGINFELFDNLGKENCEVTFNDVRFNTLSTGQRLVAGIVIVDVLKAFYKVDIPLWVDNRESISYSDIKANGQRIELRVSRNRKLKIER